MFLRDNDAGVSLLILSYSSNSPENQNVAQSAKCAPESHNFFKNIHLESNWKKQINKREEHLFGSKKDLN